MKAEYHNVRLNIDQLVKEELPHAYAFYNDKNELHADAQELFAFYTENAGKLPVYTLHWDAYERTMGVFTDTYNLLIKALHQLFTADSHLIDHYFDCAFLRKHPDFIEYAKATFVRKGAVGQAIYGRFDAAFDPVTEKVTGIYEFNGNTPVMLFESVNLQAAIASAIGSSGDQANDYYDATYGNIARLGNFGTAGIVFDADLIEDVVTCETIAQVLQDQGRVFMADLTQLDFDFTERKKPWMAFGEHLDLIFMLVPWEEAWEVFTKGFSDWRNWVDHVVFMEPAWRWFISHKGIWAYLTHLIENDVEFTHAATELPILRTYMEPPKNLTNGYVSKPVLGRMSSNIEIFDKDGKSTFKSEGPYGSEERVYQEFCPPHQVEGRNNFIIGAWMTPNISMRSLNDDGNFLMTGEATTLCIREFESPVLGTKNERFIAHRMVE